MLINSRKLNIRKTAWELSEINNGSPARNCVLLRWGDYSHNKYFLWSHFNTQTHIKVFSHYQIFSYFSNYLFNGTHVSRPSLLMLVCLKKEIINIQWWNIMPTTNTVVTGNRRDAGHYNRYFILHTYSQ